MRIGAYEIVSLLGEGGMGTVYRARDTKLNREVALKVLLPDVANDPERLARFRREAQVLASLNHPHIGAIHGLEESNGTIALVMELVEGEDLSARIARGAIPLDEALPIARQIAEALEAAHEQGIVHRDLKPANIKVRPDGTVKVLDFGLAKALDEPKGSSPRDLENSPTITSPAMTQAGVILGTAAYMAPEQAKGKAVDKRADIWAFGCVLYEMLTGTRPFKGDSLAETLAAIITEQPDVDQAPQAVRRLLRKCFEKDPRRRLRDLGDAWELLEAPAAPAVSTPATPGKTRWAWIAAMAVVTAIAIGSAIVAYRATRPVDRPLVRLSDQLETRLTVDGSMGSAVAIAADGSRVAYVTVDDAQVTHLATRRLDESKATPLSNTDGGDAPFFSPDGRWIGFFTSTALKKVSVDGGAAIVICTIPGGVRGGGFWAEDGTILFAGTSTPVLRVSSDGGTPVPITQLDSENDGASHRAAQLLPGRDAILFEAATNRRMWEDATIEVQSIESGQRKILVKGGYYGRYVPGRNASIGHLIYMHGDTLFAAPMNSARLELTGAAVPILQDVARRNGNGIAHLAIAASGTLVYVSGAQGSLDSLHWQDAAGNVEVMAAPPGRRVTPRLSPDGSRIAILTDLAAGVLSVFEVATNRLTATATGLSRAPLNLAWAPDGQHLAAQFTDATPGMGIYWVRADGAGEPQLLVPGGSLNPSSISRDGTRLIFSRSFRSADPGLWTVRLDLADPDHPKAQPPEAFLRTTLPVESAAFSPDGRWIAYSSGESGLPSEVVVRPFPGPGGKWQVSAGGGTQPRWSADGRHLLYLKGRSVMAVSYTAKGDSFQASQSRAWSPAALRSPSITPPDFDLSADGRRIVAVMPASPVGDQPPGVTFLFNFADELQRKAPGQ